MSTVAEIQAAAEALPVDQQEALYRALGARLYPDPAISRKARLVERGGDALLVASADSPPMTPERVREMLEDTP